MRKPSFHDTSLKTGERDKIEEMIDNTERRGRGGRQSDRQTDRQIERVSKMLQDKQQLRKRRLA